MTADYVRVTEPDDLFAKARELSVRTMILDLEPLVAPWPARSGREPRRWAAALIARPALAGRPKPGPGEQVRVFTAGHGGKLAAVRQLWRRPGPRAGAMRF